MIINICITGTWKSSPFSWYLKSLKFIWRFFANDDKNCQGC